MSHCGVGKAPTGPHTPGLQVRFLPPLLEVATHGVTYRTTVSNYRRFGLAH